MTMLKTAAAVACCLMVPALPALAQTPTAPAASFTVQQAVVDGPGHAPITVAIWAPTSGTKLPLVVMSHGTGGGPAGHIDTAQALARAGFVVAAPMHPGDNFQDDSSVGKPEWMANRARDLSNVIDYMLARWEGHARLSPKRIGVFGMSAGATAALVAIGGTPDLGRIAPHCSAQPEFVCKIMKAQEPATQQWVHDPRIAAAVLAAPGLGFTFVPSGLAKVHVPVQLWVGGEDQTVPYATNGALVKNQLGRSVDFHRVDGAVHLSFLAPCGPESPPVICQDKPGFDRTAFHQEFNRSVTAFFVRTLTP
ncbi:MAG: dienelactone hydrolase family protein [Alphaproteobacteria bacterium]|nr:dienelactone hydrolase family protein [Alphaproteobacteria bacterium]